MTFDKFIFDGKLNFADSIDTLDTFHNTQLSKITNHIVKFKVFNYIEISYIFDILYSEYVYYLGNIFTTFNQPLNNKTNFEYYLSKRQQVKDRNETLFIETSSTFFLHYAK
jgi:hypothetical protein